MNKLTLAPQEYIFRVPIFFEILCKFFTFILASGSWMLTFSIFSGPTPVLVKIFLLIFSLAWTLFIFSSTFRNPWIMLKANDKGCYFRKFGTKFEIKIKVSDPEFIFVPWGDIKQVSVVPDEDRSRCIGFELKVLDDVWLELNPSQKNLPKWLGVLLTPNRDGSSREFLLSNNFQNPDLVVKAILSMKPSSN